MLTASTAHDVIVASLPSHHVARIPYQQDSIDSFDSGWSPTGGRGGQE